MKYIKYLKLEELGTAIEIMSTGSKTEILNLFLINREDVEYQSVNIGDRLLLNLNNEDVLCVVVKPISQFRFKQKSVMKIKLNEYKYGRKAFILSLKYLGHIESNLNTIIS